MAPNHPRAGGGPRSLGDETVRRFIPRAGREERVGCDCFIGRGAKYPPRNGEEARGGALLIRPREYPRERGGILTTQ